MAGSRDAAFSAWASSYRSRWIAVTCPRWLRQVSSMGLHSVACCCHPVRVWSIGGWSQSCLQAPLSRLQLHTPTTTMQPGQQQPPAGSMKAMQDVCSTRVRCSALERLGLVQMALGASLKLHSSASGMVGGMGSATPRSREQGCMPPIPSTRVGLWPFSNVRGGCLSGRDGQCSVSDPQPSFV